MIITKVNQVILYYSSLWVYKNKNKRGLKAVKVTLCMQLYIFCLTVVVVLLWRNFPRFSAFLFFFLLKRFW